MKNPKSYTTPELEAMEICVEQGFAASFEDFGATTPSGLGARIGYDYNYNDQQME